MRRDMLLWYIYSLGNYFKEGGGFMCNDIYCNIIYSSEK